MAKFEQIESKFLRTFAKSADIDKGKSREVPPKIKEAGVWLNIEFTKFFFFYLLSLPSWASVTYSLTCRVI